MLQIELVGYTQIRAHDLDRAETTTWILVSQANMNMPLGNPTGKGSKQWKLPSQLWEDFPIPNTVCPGFDTCNISRRYELEIRVGLAHAMAGGVRPELIVLPLCLPVSVYSGIAPPPKLLEVMASNPSPQPVPTGLLMPPRPSVPNGLPSPTDKPLGTPVETPTPPLSEINSYPAQVGSYHTAEQSDVPDVAPPSYEDAMAEDIAPVDGPWRDYQVPPEPEAQRPAFNPDSKGGGLGRRVSERLFSSSGASTPTRTVSMGSSMQGLTISEDDMPGTPSSPSSEIPGKLSRRRKSFSGKKE